MAHVVTLLALFLLVLGLVAPAAPAQPARDRGTSATASLGSKININTASAEDLMALSGVGRQVAERIVEYRQTHGPFSKPEEIQRVRGVGKGLWNRNRSRIVVE